MESIVLNPKYHDMLTVVKAARNGAVYGAKVRFPHALVFVLPLLSFSCLPLVAGVFLLLTTPPG